MSPPELGPADWAAVRLSLALAATTTGVLLVVGTPLAWWLALGRSRWRAPVAALVAVPLVLPPTVLGFYLLILLGAEGWIGRLTTALGIGPLAFTFPGLVVGSVVYSLPFVVEPLTQAFAREGRRLLEVAATLGAGPWDRFWRVLVPAAWRGYVTAAVLAFGHTLGEFGVVLMVGGNIPGRTRVLSVALYDYVEALEYGRAHVVAAGLLVASFLLLWAVYRWGRPPGEGWP